MKITYHSLVFILLLPLSSGINVLNCLPGSVKSLEGLLSSLSLSLAKNGHRVTYIGTSVLDHPNIESIPYPKIHQLWEELDVFELRVSLQATLDHSKKITYEGSTEFWDDPRTMEVWKRRNDFDIFLTISYFAEMTFPFLIDFKGSFVQFCTPGVEMLSMSREGNWLSPAVVPSILMNYDDSMSFWERFINLPSSYIPHYMTKESYKTYLESIRKHIP